MFPILLFISFLGSVPLEEGLLNAQAYLENADMKAAIPAFEALSTAAIQEEFPEIYYQAQLGLATCYQELGAYYLSIHTLGSLAHQIDTTRTDNFLYMGRAMQAMTENYRFLFNLEQMRESAEQMQRYYRRYDPREEIFDVVYNAYIGYFFNFRLQVQEACTYTDAALKIYRRNKNRAHLIPVHLPYEAHILTTRNFRCDASSTKLYADTLEYLLNKHYPQNSPIKARAISSLNNWKLDFVNAHFKNPNSASSNREISRQIDVLLGAYQKGIDWYKKVFGPRHEYVYKFYYLQILLCVLDKRFEQAESLFQEAFESIPESAYLSEGFYINPHSYMAILRLRILGIEQELQQYFSSELVSKLEVTLEKLQFIWNYRMLEIISGPDVYATNLYNQNPFKLATPIYGKLYVETGEHRYLEKFHQNDELSRYNSLIFYKSLSELADGYRDELLSRRQAILLLINRHMVAEFLGRSNASRLQEEIEKKIEVQKNFKSLWDKFSYPHVPSLSDMQERLAPNEARISYLEHTNELWVKTITHTGTYLERLYKNFFEDWNWGKFQPSILNALETGDVEEFKDQAQKLSPILLEPFIKHLPAQVNSLEILPTGFLYYLPFEILLTDTSSSSDFRKLPYLLHRYAIRYGMSAAIDVPLEADAYEVSEPLVVLSPTISDSSLPSLAFSADQASALSEKYGGRVASGGKATKADFFSALKESSIVMLVSHGGSSTIENPAYKSLFLSDGKLEMDVVYQQKAMTNLLVLNTCESGLGFLDWGAGSINFGRAFSSIGVKSLLLSYWEIDEFSSMKIANKFFEYLQEGQSKSFALRQAKLDYLESAIPRTGNPYYWAGQYLLGDNANVKPHPEEDSVPVWALLSPALLLLLWWWWSRNREI